MIMTTTATTTTMGNQNSFSCYISKTMVKIDVVAVVDVVVVVAVVDVVVAFDVAGFVYLRVIFPIHMAAITGTLAFVILFGFPIFNWWRSRVF